MSVRAEIDISAFKPAFGNELGDVCVLVTDAAFDALASFAAPMDIPVERLAWTGPETRSRLLARLASLREDGRRASVMWIAESEFEHFPDDELTHAKVLALSGFSEGFDPETLAATIQLVRTTDYLGELELEARLLAHLDDANTIVFESEAHAEHGGARFEYQAAEHWFSIHGPLAFGQQAVLPTGELSALVDASGEFEAQAHFELDGPFVLRGHPIVHRGHADVSRELTRSWYQRLAVLIDVPVILHLEAGFVRSVAPLPAGPSTSAEALDALFLTDDRYRKIHELGLGTNVACRPLRTGNYFPNERYPGVHLGIGLGGHTDFHIDLVSTDTRVEFEYVDGRRVELYRELGIAAQTS